MTDLATPDFFDVPRSDNMRAFVVANKYGEVEKFWGKVAVGKVEKRS